MYSHLKKMALKVLAVTPLILLTTPNNKAGTVIPVFLLVMALILPIDRSDLKFRKPSDWIVLLGAAGLAILLGMNLVQFSPQFLIARLLHSQILLLSGSIILGLCSIPVLYFFMKSCFLQWNRTVNRIGIWPAAGILAVLVWIVQGALPVYADIDNYYISLVTNGLYSSADYICQLPSPIIAWMVKGFDLIFPAADGFAALMEIFMVLGCWLLFGLIMERSRKPFAVWTAWFLIMICILQINLFHTNYSVIGAFLLIAGFCGFMNCLQSKKPRYGILTLSSLIVLFGGGLRYQALYLMMPYLFLAVLYLFWKKDAVIRSRKTAAVLGILALTVLINPVSQKILFLQPDWHSGIVYSDSRAELVDYPIAPYESVQDQLEAIDVTQTDYNAIRSIILLDTEKYTADYLYRLASLVKLKVSIRFNLNGLMSMIMADPQILYVFIFLIASMLAVLVTARKPWHEAVMFFLALSGSFLILSYFQSAGRILPRVIIPVVFGCMLTVYTAWLSAKNSRTLSRPLRSLLLAVSLIFCCFVYQQTAPGKGFHLFETLYAQNSESVIPESEIGDIRVWSVYDQISLLENYYYPSGKLPGEALLKSQIPDGGWMYGQPYFNAFLEEIHSPNPLAVLAQPGMTYVGSEKRAGEIAGLLEENGYGTYIIQPAEPVFDYETWSFVPASE